MTGGVGLTAVGWGSGAMADLEKNPLAKLIDWFSSWKASFNQLQEHIGWVGAGVLLLLTVAVLIWWKWEDIVKRPGVKGFIERLFSRNLTLPSGSLGTTRVVEAERLALEGRNEQARTAYDEARTLCKQLNNHLGEANVLFGLGSLESGLGRSEQARSAYDAAAQLFGSLGMMNYRDEALRAAKSAFTPVTYPPVSEASGGPSRPWPRSSASPTAISPPATTSA
jgi:hypothetical protein